MIFPEQFEQKIGFDSIRQLISDRCISESGKHFARKIHFTHQISEIKKQIGQVMEFAQILHRNIPFPEQHFYNLSPYLEHAKVEGSILGEEAFFDIRRTLQTINQCANLIHKQKDMPLLRELATQVNIDTEFLKAIQKVIDDFGKIRDSASSELYQIRKDLFAEQANLRHKLDDMLKKLQESEESPADLSLTVRNGRLVIPIYAEYKRKIKGLIYDESHTGQTVFLEPMEAFDANNRIKELENDEKREVRRLLLNLTDQLRTQLTSIKTAYRFLGIIDCIRAKAMLSLQYHGALPAVDELPLLHWHGVVHPLLYMQHQAQQKPTIPLSVTLDSHTHALVISGPNAGGKSVALKTLGLLQYMFQCGLPIPFGEASTFGIFHKIAIAIGDSQSIDNELSTYSSHLEAMKNILDLADQKTLILIDEFGAGTDPQYGGAIAEALLDTLVKKKAFTVVNTHYANLKYFAENTQGVCNGAMLFDYDTLSPRYELRIGKPGNSFALEIAEKIGLPPRIIDLARQKIGKELLKVDELLKELQIEKQKHEQQQARFTIQTKNLEKVTRQYEELKQSLENRKAELLQKAREDAKKILQQAKLAANKALQDLKSAKNLEELKQKNVKGRLSHLEKELGLEKNMHKAKDEEGQFPQTSYEVGQNVRFKGQEGIFTITQIRGDEVELLAGELKINTKISRLLPAGNQKPQNTRNTVRFQNGNLADRMANFSHTLDIRGMRANNVVAHLEKYLDEALLVSSGEVRIIHGKGDGVLRNVVREHLKRISFVSDFYDEKHEFGGSGITVVTFKK